ncbi:MAG: hypothetical protein OEM63_04775 [Gammaproteobacteria bacterium]|nr:hypothetical protein [Gammaproteobacteria bacterium]
MNCDYIADNMGKIVYGKLSGQQMADCRRHLFNCPECMDAVRGAEALALLRNCGPQSVPEGLFDKLSSALQNPSPSAAPARPRFWAATGIGGALAASLFMAAMAIGWIGPAAVESEHVADFAVAVSEPKIMNVAIESDRPLQGATISILLSGDIELEGFSGERELTWITDLEEGVNRLQLPVIALDPSGGKMIVRLDHPDTEQVYVVNVDTTA